jgi:hypothetical protein
MSKDCKKLKPWEKFSSNNLNRQAFKSSDVVSLCPQNPRILGPYVSEEISIDFIPVLFDNILKQKKGKSYANWLF